MLCLVAVSRVPLPQVACGSGWRKLRTRVALSVGLAWRFASDSGGENFGLGSYRSWRTAEGRTRALLNAARPRWIAMGALAGKRAGPRRTVKPAAEQCAVPLRGRLD